MMTAQDDEQTRLRIRLAQQRDRSAEMRRARDITAKGSSSDHGTTGPAQAARPFRVGETIQAGVTHREMLDGHPLTYYGEKALLSQRQIDAGQWLCTRFSTAGLRHGDVVTSGGQTGGNQSDEDAERQTRALREYDMMMRRIAPRCHATVCRLVRGEYPNEIGGLDLLRDALDTVAEALKMPKDGK